MNFDSMNGRLLSISSFGEPSKYMKYIEKYANQFELLGWVRPAQDGTIRVAISCGDNQKIKIFIDKIKVGPKKTTVKRINIYKINVSFKNFKVYYAKQLADINSLFPDSKPEFLSVIDLDGSLEVEQELENITTNITLKNDLINSDLDEKGFQVSKIHDFFSAYNIKSLNQYDDCATDFCLKSIGKSSISADFITYYIFLVSKHNLSKRKLLNFRRKNIRLEKIDLIRLILALRQLSDDILNPVSKLYLLCDLEGDGLNSEWVKIALDIIKNANNEHLCDFYDLASLAHPSNRSRGQKEGVPICFNIKGWRYIHSQIEIEKDRIFSKVTIGDKVYNDNKLLVFLIGKPFPGRTNTHAMFFNSFLKLITIWNENQTVEKEKFAIKFLITGESSFSTPWKDFQSINSYTLDKNFEILQSLGLNKEDFITFTNSNNFNKCDVLNNSFEWLKGIKPYAVCFLGGVYESRLFRYKCFPHFPIALFPTTSDLNSHLGRPDSFFDCFRVLHSSHQDGLIQRGYSDKMLCSFPYPLWREDYQSKATFNWADGFDLKNKPDGFLFSTVLGGGRIRKIFSSFSKEEKNSFLNLFRIHDHLKWLVVGESLHGVRTALDNDEYLNQLIADKRIFVSTHLDNLLGFFREIDLLYMVGHGGGNTIRMAISSGLPVIGPHVSDSVDLIEKELIFNSVPESINIIDSRVAKKQNIPTSFVKELFDSNESFNHADISSKFVGMIKLTVDNYNARLNADDNL